MCTTHLDGGGAWDSGRGEAWPELGLEAEGSGDPGNDGGWWRRQLAEQREPLGRPSVVSAGVGRELANNRPGVNTKLDPLKLTMTWPPRQCPH